MTTAEQERAAAVAKKPYVRKSLSVYPKPIPARSVLMATGLTYDQAENALRALAEAGYGVAPREPTNGMLAAYIEATAPPKHHEAVITAIGKARARWSAMLEQGHAMAMSRKFMPAIERGEHHGGEK